MKFSRDSTLVFILAIIVVCMLLAQLFFAILLLTKNYEKANEIEAEKISISGFTSINLVNTTTFSRPQYDPLQGHLGLTGKLYLDCYTGSCTYQRQGKKRCSYEDDCNWEYYTYYETEINKSCSIQCSQTNEAKCTVCPSGKCTKKYNDKYDSNKVCYADNVIYFWKGKTNEGINIGDYDYLNNAYLNDELCPTGTKNCGILDDNKNKLCIEDTVECPMNIISETKLDNYKFSTNINGKTYYFKNDNSSKEKLFSGLCVDTDLLLNNNTVKDLIFDTYTISGLLEENTHLYQGINLGYDPYQEKNIDNKGKSYLKLCYNNVRNPDLNSIRSDRIVYNRNRNINSYIDGFNHHKTGLYILEIIGCAILIVGIILFIRINKIFFYLIYIGLILFFIPVIKAFKNINRLNKLKDLDNRYDYSAAKIINILYIIFNLVLCVVLLVSPLALLKD